MVTNLESRVILNPEPYADEQSNHQPQRNPEKLDAQDF